MPLQVHAAMLLSLARVSRMALKIAREHSVCRRLMTVLGVRTVLGLTFIAAIEDPARFAKSCSVGAILGMMQRKRPARRPPPRYCAVEA